MHTNKEKMPLEVIQSQVDAWIKQYGVRYFSPLTNMAILAEETGEVARIISRRYGEQSAKNEEQITLEKLGEELSDLIFVAVCIANEAGIDLQNAFDKKMKFKTERDKDRHAANIKLQNSKNGNF